MPTTMREMMFETGPDRPATAAARPPAAPVPGRIEAATLVTIPQGTYGGIAYQRYEAMFAGVTPRGDAYHVPCQLIAPAPGQSRSGLVLFDWLNTAGVVLGLEGAGDFAVARFFLTDEFLFSQGIGYAAVRCDPIALGLPWLGGDLNTSTESIESAGDEFDIVADFVKALETDPVARNLLGQIDRTAGFGYSRSGGRLRGLLRLDTGEGLFDFSLVGGSGSGFNFPTGNKIGASWHETPPPSAAGLEIDFTSASVATTPGISRRTTGPTNSRGAATCEESMLRSSNCPIRRRRTPPTGSASFALSSRPATPGLTVSSPHPAFGSGLRASRRSFATPRETRSFVMSGDSP